MNVFGRRSIKHWGAVVAIASLASLTAACSSTPSSSSSTSSPSSKIPSSLTVSSFNVNFSQMSRLKSLTSAGSGLVGVILPDETSSTRYVDFDAPYLTKAFQKAGYSSSGVQDRQRPGSRRHRAR